MRIYQSFRLLSSLFCPSELAGDVHTRWAVITLPEQEPFHARSTESGLPLLQSANAHPAQKKRRMPSPENDVTAAPRGNNVGFGG